ncbi:MAG TPA: hypothetical protein VLU43_07710 [Anaeromyxobacteraceae bacterium]|nr:hypothetical protein [Anaeromyxobacteraceae bacterium]
MKRLSRWPRRRLVAGGILAIGWASALVVYLTAVPAVGYPEIDDMEHSKSYQRQMEVIGGKAAVVANELNEWLASLWRGQRLAYTIAAITTIVALAYHWWTSSPAPRRVE